MEYLVKDQKLELKYEPGKGAWTYHIQIPNTKHIVGKWGSLKVSGTIDDYKIESINLAKLGDQDKLISINDKIRKAINKSGGDTVTVTLYVLTSQKQITEEEILETFEDANVLKVFEKLSEEERNDIFRKITSLKTEDKQIKMILNFINQLNTILPTTSFTPFPILTTQRLTLRQLSGDDQHDIFDLRSDAEVNKYLGRAPSKTLEDAINFIDKINENIKNNNSMYWAISLTSTKIVVGAICLFNFSDEKNSCEIGYELMKKFQGQGIMKEATEKVINYAFQTLQFQKIIASTHKENQPSTKLLTRLNFVQSEEKDKENPDLNVFMLTNSH